MNEPDYSVFNEEDELEASQIVRKAIGHVKLAKGEGLPSAVDVAAAGIILDNIHRKPVPGPAGPRGEPGLRGADGMAGPRGLTGMTGEVGQAGPQGEAPKRMTDNELWKAR